MMPDTHHSTSPEPSPYVFVVGCPRSGTTLLQRMLNHHPLLAVANDTHFITRCLEKFAPHRISGALAGGDVELSPELVDGVVDYRRFHRLGLDEAEGRGLAHGLTTYAGYIGALYREFARRNGKPLGGEKTPDYVRHLPLLHGLFPDARSVHIIRDGRDTTLSVLDWAGATKGPGKLELWEREPVATCALWWRWQVRSGRRAGASLGAHCYTEVRYEELVAQPEQELRRISGFLRLPYAAEMLSYHEGKTRRHPGLSAKSAWLPPTAGLRDWRRQMSARDLELWEALAGDQLDELGLERGAGKIGPEISRVAESCRRWWNTFLAQREAKARRRVANHRPASGRSTGKR